MMVNVRAEAVVSANKGAFVPMIAARAPPSLRVAVRTATRAPGYYE